MREKELEKLKDYKYGFSTDIENIKAPKGLNKEVIKENFLLKFHLVLILLLQHWYIWRLKVKLD